MSDIPASLSQCVVELVDSVPQGNCLWVGYSGGLDSTVLLHSLMPLLPHKKIGVIHVNHQLSPLAPQWQAHCVSHAEAWGFELIVVESVVVERDGEGLEQAARKARYEVFERQLAPNDILLLAHHRQDQTETFMLRLARGAGVDGLSAMRPLRRFQRGWLGRPFLSIDKVQLLAYAKAANLSWIEDPSNQSLDFDRNLLRNHLLPPMRERWPSWDKQVTKAAQLLQETQTLLDEYLESDLQQLQPQGEKLGQSICLKQLQKLSPEKIIALVRFWLKSMAYRSPSRTQLNQLFLLIHAGQDRCPLLHWGDCELRRFQQRLFCLPANWSEQSLARVSLLPAANVKTIHFGPMEIFETSAEGGFIPLATDQIKPLKDLRAIGKAHPAQRHHSQSLKKLLQEYRVPPWLRDCWPAIERNGELVAVVGLWVEQKFNQSTTTMDIKNYDWRWIN